MSESVSVNFKRSFPLFPLPETVLLPHTLVPLAVSESRYTQLVDHALDGFGQIAVATFDKPTDATPLRQTPQIRSALCLGQIVQHDPTPYGYNILVYGLCRAKFQTIEDPTSEIYYSKVMLKPSEHSKEENVEHHRENLIQLLQRPNLQRLVRLEALSYWVQQEEISTPALFELIGGSLFEDAEFRYELLSEPSCERRTKKILSELQHLDVVLTQSKRQSQSRWEKGISWN